MEELYQVEICELIFFGLLFEQNKKVEKTSSLGKSENRFTRRKELNLVAWIIIWILFRKNEDNKKSSNKTASGGEKKKTKDTEEDNNSSRNTKEHSDV